MISIFPHVRKQVLLILCVTSLDGLWISLWDASLDDLCPGTRVQPTRFWIWRRSSNMTFLHRMELRRRSRLCVWQLHCTVQTARQWCVYTHVHVLHSYVIYMRNRSSRCGGFLHKETVPELLLLLLLVVVVVVVVSSIKVTNKLQLYRLIYYS
jgi:hypothetical protein